MDEQRLIKRCITTHEYAAPEMLLAGTPRSKDYVVGASADIYSWGVMMMDVIGTQHPLHPHIKSPIQEGEETKMINLFQSRPHHLRIHGPRCYRSTKFTNLLERATVHDANKRATVGDLLEGPALPEGLVYYYREMVAPTLFDKGK